MDEVTWSKIDLIPGWLFREEADLLNRLNDKGMWCELGSWKGKSTAVLAQRRKGYAIDWFNGIVDANYNMQNINTYAEYLSNIEPYRDNIITLPMQFQDAISKIKHPINLLFLDAEHNYIMTKLAFIMYNHLVPVGGHIIFHDAWGENGERTKTPLPEVTKFIREILKDKSWKNTENVRRCAVFRRIK